MLVIHPTDRTTAMLSLLYQGMDGVTLLTQSSCNAEIKSRLNHVSKQERIMLLGHGSENGLFSRGDDCRKEFDRLIISHSHAYYLRKHGGNMVAVWCNADLFARKEGLHGLFSGMIISEMDEAELYNIPTSQEELDEENVKLATRLRSLLDTGTPLHEIPLLMRGLDDRHSTLTEFNYKNFYYL